MPSSLASRFTLDPEVVFLNHGSFGACPLEVQEAQAELRARMESEPVRFFHRELPVLLDGAREVVARFVGASADDVVFVRNATSAVAAVLASLSLSPGDELLTTDHAYGACKNALDHVAERHGARVVVAKVPFPLAAPGDAASAILGAATDRTRLALIDHVTSPTGLVLPIEAIVAELEERGVPVLVDGAHAPGMLPLSLDALSASYYTGNLHKWVCAPKGAAMLHVRRDRQATLHPSVISHGRSSRRSRSRLHEEFDWCGTDDPTSWLSVPTAIEVMDRMVPGGWDEVRARNRSLALEARALLLDGLGVPVPAPSSMIASLAAVPLAIDGEPPTSGLDLDPLQVELYDRHRIQVPIFTFAPLGCRMVRISAQLYNIRADYEALVSALVASLDAMR